MMLRPAFVMLTSVLMLGSASAQAAELNGRFIGTIDGHDIDVPVRCQKPPGLKNWYQVASDPSERDNRSDRNGDGIVIEVNGQFGGKGAVFANVNGKEYTFGGDTDSDPSGLKLATEISRLDKATRKFVPVYRVDLKVTCAGGWL